MQKSETALGVKLGLRLVTAFVAALLLSTTSAYAAFNSDSTALRGCGVYVHQSDEVHQRWTGGFYAPNSGVDLTLKNKAGWTDAQRAAAQQKAQALTDADTVVTPNPARSGTAQSRYRRDNALDSNTDADHIIDLQLGGADDAANLWGLDKSVNRSLGSQIQHQIKDLPAGTRVNNVNVVDP